MNVHEWPLTAFTILAQMAVGAFFTLGIVNLLARSKYSVKTVDRLAKPALYAIGPIMVLALIASMFHLGTPLNAPNAIRNIATSWLAREILFGAGFAVLGFLFALATWFQWFSEKIRTTLAIFTAAWGLIFIWVMASVYMLPTVPAWNHWTTPATFYLSAALMGSLAIAVAFSAWPQMSSKWPGLSQKLTGHNTKPDPETYKLTGQVTKWIAIANIVLLALQLVVTSYSAAKPAGPNPAEVEASPTAQAIRLILLIIGAGLISLYLTATTGTHKPSTQPKKLLNLTLTSYVLVTISEIIARLAFYAENNRIGI
ncbi:MAG: dimethyl sulfoxide reductase anchor subunit [Actinomycetaceae bacterium]|nr:dimethyl sulfoxide reductase anchor subunit [Actinomycetaceae bacterium]